MVKSLEATKNYYNGIAKGYSELYHKEQQEKIELVSEFLPEKGLVLDCGSGDGVLNQYLEDCFVVSCDLSLELLKLNSNNHKINCSITSLPFKDNSFDIVCSFTVIQDIEQMDDVAGEINRVLKNKGKLIVTFLKIAKKAEKIEELFDEKFRLIEKRESEKDILLIFSSSEL